MPTTAFYLLCDRFSHTLASLVLYTGEAPAAMPFVHVGLWVEWPERETTTHPVPTGVTVQMMLRANTSSHAKHGWRGVLWDKIYVPLTSYNKTYEEHVVEAQVRSLSLAHRRASTYFVHYVRSGIPVAGTSRMYARTRISPIHYPRPPSHGVTIFSRTLRWKRFSRSWATCRNAQKRRTCKNTRKQLNYWRCATQPLSNRCSTPSQKIMSTRIDICAS